MKPRYLFLAFLCFTGLYACISQSVTAAFPSNTIKSFTGTLDGKPVHVFLNSADSTIHGWYSFDDSNSIVIRLKSDRKLTNDPAFTLTEDKESSQQDSIESKTENIPVWQCTYQEGKVTGTKSYTTSHGLQKARISLTEDYPAGTYPFTLKTFSHTYDAFPGKDSTPHWAIDYSYPVCTQQGANADWINRQVKLNLNKNPDLSFDTIIHQIVQTGLKDYRTQMQDMAEDSTIAAMGFRPSMDYTTSLAINVTYTQADYLVFSTEVYDYSGGAHGNYATTYDCYDVLHKIHLNLSAILTADSTTLQRLLEIQYRKDNHLSPTEALASLFEGSLPTTKNFYFNGTGIGFLYNPYEVASYAVGYIDLFLPYKQLDKYLNPAFKKRVHL